MDGNKRLAWSATRIFCLLEGRDLIFPIDEAEAAVVAVASGHLDIPDLAVLLDRHIVVPREG